MCDVATCKHAYYPHWNQLKELKKNMKQPRLFSLVFRYSLLYNFPFISLFSFRDKSVHTWARTLWLGGLLCLSYSLSFLIFYNGTKAANAGIIALIGFLLSFLFLPNSCLFCILKRTRFTGKQKASAVAPFSSPKASERHLRAGDKNPDISGELDLIGPMRKEETKSKMTATSKICLGLFIALLVVLWGGAIVLTVATLD